MGSTGSTRRTTATIITASTANDENLGSLREEAFRKKAREDIASALNAIKANAKAAAEDLHVPLDPSRPYGLPKELEENPGHIWKLILDHVNDLGTINCLRQVCELFRDILDRKYVAARLPAIISHCLKRKVIASTAGGRTAKSTWLETMSSLRILSAATKSSVDALFFNRGMLRETGWFCTGSPYFCTDQGKMPILKLGVLNVEIVRLQETLESPDLFPLRAIVFNERQIHQHDDDDEDDDDEDDVDLQAIRNSFHKLLKKIGNKITSFRYTASENPLNTYNNLRSCVVSMPNLEELIVHFTGPRATTFYQNVDAFPTLPKLKRYAEGPRGFGCPYILEIFKANPTIEEVLVGKAMSSDVEVNKMIHMLDSLPVKRLHCTWEPSILFLEHQFHWASQLTMLCIWDWGINIIPSSKLFAFISRFRNLSGLALSVHSVLNDGGFISLSRLKHVRWRVNPTLHDLEFLKHVESLKLLELDFCRFEAIGAEEEIMNYLWKSGIPALFPALKVVNVKTGGGDSGAFRAIWKKFP